mmetsp:Transcript_16318/g.32639  ORF Transcript_16318/g.32639 Transcript_16318/m.32639 type:complete len:1094 (+) Transcript_16318:115-3396(+)|eukprot:CAMPEP_0181300988 /NCGR_PEP_ID=MMETSP1101-20121128/7185_1 /TAXON_ID=46948 /ORGANISM="Rhodomonas abbreviata, Strain Caron Lab Isolate" /LENGTH=1093 /DNA_ID=CAMNT_0023406265 /DNA_START=104 /DNA_END=3385 /DNA_ORIENTATION=+
MAEGGLFRQLFDQLDKDKSGKLSMEELHAALEHAESGLVLVESSKLQRLIAAKGRKFRALRRAESPGTIAAQKTQHKEDVGSEESDEQVTFEEFQEVMKEIFKDHYSRFFLSLNIHELLADAIITGLEREASEEPELDKESKAFKPLTGISSMSSEKLSAFANRLLVGVQPELSEKMCRGLHAEKEYAKEQQRCEDATAGKFVDMVLGPLPLFHQGLEGLLGPPDPHVFVMMEREHTGMKDSNDEFHTWNSGPRISTPAGEWRKLVDEAGNISVTDYEGNPMLHDGEVVHDWMEHPMTIKAGLSREEVIGIRLYTGPCFQKYNGKLRDAIKRLDELLKEGNSAIKAIETVQKESGRSYVTTIHVINSALIKISRITSILGNRKVLRGFSGLKVPDCFREPDEYGCQGGIEAGFLSTSTDSKQAVGYIKHEHGMPQMFEMTVGQVDRGASISWISLFPGEEEVLLPPLSSLEKTGASRFERTAKGMVMVTPISLNVNLKGRTIEEHKAMRKTLHMQTAENAVQEISIWLRERMASDAVRDRIAHGHSQFDNKKHVKDMEASIMDHCRKVVEVHRARDSEWYNSDEFYADAIEEVQTLKILAGSVVDLWLLRGLGAEHASAASHLSLKDAKHRLTRQLMKDVEKSKEELEDQEVVDARLLARKQSSAARVCQLMALSSEDIEQRGAKTGGLTPLLYWSEQGNVMGAKLLIDAGAKIEEVSEDGMSALHLAARGGQHDLVNLLAQAGVPLDVQDDRGKTALMLAAVEGAAEAVGVLLKKGSALEKRDTCDRTALMLACQHGHLAVVEVLLKHGAQYEIVDCEKQPPIWIAAHNGHLEIVKLLVASGADVNAFQRSDGASVLWIAAASGHKEIVEFLVDRGAKVDAGLNRDAQTVFRYDGELVKQLATSPCGTLYAMRAGRSIYLSDARDGVTVMSMSLPWVADLAAFHPEKYELAMKVDGAIHVCQLEEKRWWVAGPSDDIPPLPWPTPTLKPHDSVQQLGGCSPLWIAAANGKLAIVSLLLKRDADANAGLRSGVTPLMEAARAGHVEVVEQLCRGGADVSAKCKFGTALDMVRAAGAAETLDAEKVKALERLLS